MYEESSSSLISKIESVYSGNSAVRQVMLRALHKLQPETLFFIWKALSQAKRPNSIVKMRSAILSQSELELLTTSRYLSVIEFGYAERLSLDVVIGYFDSPSYEAASEGVTDFCLARVHAVCALASLESLPLASRRDIEYVVNQYPDHMTLFADHLGRSVELSALMYDRDTTDIDVLRDRVAIPLPLLDGEL